MKKGQFRKTEWCRWIDDNWLVIGQSNFYKRDFEKALKRFIYIEKQYSKEPIKYTSMLWQAKTYIELEDYEEAEDILKKLIEGEEELAQFLKSKKRKKKSKKENPNLALSLNRRASPSKRIKPHLLSEKF